MLSGNTTAFVMLDSQAGVGTYVNSNGIKDWWKAEETTSLYQSYAQTPQSYSWKPYIARVK